MTDLMAAIQSATTNTDTLADDLRRPCRPGLDARVRRIDALRLDHGPGVRFTVNLQGCPLRCRQCLEREGRGEAGDPLSEYSHLIDVESIVARILHYADYLRLSGGGVTVCGGEPLMQAPAVAALFRRCRELGIPTALDTTGDGNLFSAHGLLHLTDLVILDVTGFDPDLLAERPVANGVRFARHVSSLDKPLWLRLTVIPGLTDQADRLAALAGFAQTLPTLRRVVVVPQDGLDNADLLRRCALPLVAVAERPTGEQLRAVCGAFRRIGLRAG